MNIIYRFIKIISISSCLFVAGISYSQASDSKSNSSSFPFPFPQMNPHHGAMSSMANPMTMMNPMMSMNMMYPMMGMMGPMMMGPMMGMMNPMTMMNPMMSMNMMYPMMGMMGPMMSPMSSMGMPGMGNAYGSNPLDQMMDPKQYQQWFSQWTDMMKSFAPQTQ